MNKYILFVIDHLANPDKYTKAQLEDNVLAAWDAAVAAFADDDDDDIYATYAAHRAGNAANAADASYWVDEYFERSGENKDDYIKELNK